MVNHAESLLQIVKKTHAAMPEEEMELCCTRSARHGTLFPFLVFTPYFRLRADGRCRAVQARLCRKRCRHVIGLGLISYL